LFLSFNIQFGIECQLFHLRIISQGGAVRFYGAGNHQVIDCVFINNRARNGAAIYADSSANVQIVSTNFRDNIAANQGASAYLVSGTARNVISDSNILGKAGNNRIIQGGCAGIFIENTGTCISNQSTRQESIYYDQTTNSAIFPGGYSAAPQETPSQILNPLVWNRPNIDAYSGLDSPLDAPPDFTDYQLIYEPPIHSEFNQVNGSNSTWSGIQPDETTEAASFTNQNSHFGSAENYYSWQPGASNTFYQYTGPYDYYNNYNNPNATSPYLPSDYYYEGSLYYKSNFGPQTAPTAQATPYLGDVGNIELTDSFTQYDSACIGTVEELRRLIESVAKDDDIITICKGIYYVSEEITILQNDITIKAEGPAENEMATTLTGSSIGRIFNVRGSGVTLEGLRFANAGNCYNNMNGGALYVGNNRFTLRKCDFINNQSGLSGGAVYVEPSRSEIVIDQCTFQGNQAKKEGGAISVGRDTVIIDSYSSLNSAKQCSEVFYPSSRTCGTM